MCVILERFWGWAYAIRCWLWWAWFIMFDHSVWHLRASPFSALYSSLCLHSISSAHLYMIALPFPVQMHSHPTLPLLHSAAVCNMQYETEINKLSEERLFFHPSQFCRCFFASPFRSCNSCLKTGGKLKPLPGDERLWGFDLAPCLLLDRHNCVPPPSIFVCYITTDKPLSFSDCSILCHL